jgi:hypothetical protein
MNNKMLLVKSITLLFRESQLPVKTENSADLIRTVIGDMQIPDVGVGMSGDRETIMGLKELVTEMCNSPLDQEYNVGELLQRVKVSVSGDDSLYEGVELGIVEIMKESELKRLITNAKKSINNHFREQNISSILDKAAYAFRFSRDKIKDTNQFVRETISQLEPLQALSTMKDPSILDDVDMGDSESVKHVFDKVKNDATGESILKTGWNDLNIAIQGGFRRGEFALLNALQHKNKTGTTLSLFAQIALVNTPHLIDPTKKPLLLRISCEDSLSSNFQYLYQYLKVDETKEPVDVSKVSTEEMTAYVQSKLKTNGWHCRFMKIDPTLATYRTICDEVIRLEAQGYEVVLCMVDYLAKIPTTGCITTGPGGTDLRDMFRRIRNFMGPKMITFITPHQLSTEAKQLLRTGVPEANFVKEINEKGYYAGSKQLDQELDLELNIHLFAYQKEYWMSIQRGKHRIPTIIGDDQKYFLMKFNIKGMPIQSDYGKETISVRKLPSGSNNGPSAGSLNF